MRAFSDDTGRVWDVVVGRESWGALFAIFVPRTDSAADPADAPPEVRQTPLRASGYDEAHGELEDMTEADLRDLLRRSAPKDTA